mmetsp:Transcript_7843/g.25605  ORF Transcript_7843/g.25605 Transcript_7843/m.25605 type:complete len:329 (-) Transcript_7843:75-1061(-)
MRKSRELVRYFAPREKSSETASSSGAASKAKKPSSMATSPSARASVGMTTPRPSEAPPLDARYASRAFLDASADGPDPCRAWRTTSMHDFISARFSGAEKASVGLESHFCSDQNVLYSPYSVESSSSASSASVNAASSSNAVSFSKCASPFVFNADLSDRGYAAARKSKTRPHNSASRARERRRRRPLHRASKAKRAVPAKRRCLRVSEGAKRSSSAHHFSHPRGLAQSSKSSNMRNGIWAKAPSVAPRAAQAVPSASQKATMMQIMRSATCGSVFIVLATALRAASSSASASVEPRPSYAVLNMAEASASEDRAQRSSSASRASSIP